MFLIPSPKKTVITDKFIEKTPLKVELTFADTRISAAVSKLPVASDGTKLHITSGNKNSEEYILKICDDGIFIDSEGPAGAFYGIQTLRQIYETCDKIPCCTIEDCPDFEYRGFYHDVTRGKVPTLATLKALVDNMAYYKMNSLQLYVEHSFEFKEYEDSIQRTGYLTAEEITELDRYCSENFVELIPSVSTFGHLYELLSKDKYKHLCEIENFEAQQIFWIDRMQHHTIDPLNPESFELIKSIIDQYLPLFTSNKFNICCDETFDLSAGKHEGMDTGKLYIDFATKIINYVRSKGKQVMMWGDVLHQHPEQIENIPDDVILLNWSYAPDPDKHMIEKFKIHGKTQIVCPGTHSWKRLCEKLIWSVPNMSLMSELAHEVNEVGVLNTNWGDFGNPCSMELAMYGFTLGAQKSWNVASDTNDFAKKADALIYKHKGASDHLKELSDIHDKIAYSELVRHYSNMLYENKIECEIPCKETLSDCHKRCIDLISKLQSEHWGNDIYREEMLIAAEGVLVMTELFAGITGYHMPRCTNTRNWLMKYRNMWLSKNKESELCEIEKMFITIEDSL